jgi:Mycolic acid cyclopropane synthetase
MNYSCAYYREGDKDDDLCQAQINKMDLVARKLKLKPGMRCLDLGSGFGAMAKHLATNYGVSVVGYTCTWKQNWLFCCFVVLLLLRVVLLLLLRTCRGCVFQRNDETPPPTTHFPMCTYVLRVYAIFCPHLAHFFSWWAFLHTHHQQ